MSWWQEEYDAIWRGDRLAEKEERERRAHSEVSEDGKWVTLRKAAEIIGRSEQTVRGKLILWNMVAAEKRDGRWWVLLEDAERMARHYRERAEQIEMNRELPKKTVIPKVPTGWKAKRPTPSRVDFANTPTLENEIWILTDRAASYLDIQPYSFRLTAMNRGLAYRERMIPNPVSGSGHHKTKRVREWALSHVLLLMDEREAFESWRCLAPGQHLDNRGKRYVFPLDEMPPGMWRITANEAAQILGVSHMVVLNFVRNGRLFGWQEIVGRRGCRMYLDGNQVTRYANSPDRLARRQARLGLTTPDPEKKRLNDEFLEKIKVNPETGIGTGHYAYHNYGDFYSARQTAEYLGVSVQAVFGLVKRRRLRGYHKARKGPLIQWDMWEKPYPTHRSFFFKKADVHALAEDPVYQKGRACLRLAEERKCEREYVEQHPPEASEEEYQAGQDAKRRARAEREDADLSNHATRGW
jgi:hypothetical protein